MIPVTMMPVGATGDSAPAWAPLPTMIAIRNGGMPARPATAIAIGAIIDAVATLPGPSDAISAGEHEEHHRHQPDVAAAQAHRRVRHAVQRAVQLRLREEQRHAGERQKELRRKAAQHVVEAHAAGVDADQPRQRQAQHADVQLGDAADDHGDDERAEGEPGQVHGAVSIAGWYVVDGSWST